MESAAGVSAGNKAALTGTPVRLLSGSLIPYLLPAHAHTKIIIIMGEPEKRSSRERAACAHRDHFHGLEHPEE